jgi:hypothetical protein
MNKRYLLPGKKQSKRIQNGYKLVVYLFCKGGIKRSGLDMALLDKIYDLFGFSAMEGTFLTIPGQGIQQADHPDKTKHTLAQRHVHIPYH